MVASQLRTDRHPLRHWLKEGTAVLHDRLDASTNPAELGDDGRYAAFLSVQYRARKPIEDWAQGNLDADIRPPEMAELIAQDLLELSYGVPDHASFTLSASAEPIGVAWAIGGSSLGNKVLLSERRRTGACHAERFLSDSRGITYFRSLLPRLTTPANEVDAASTIRAAEAVFQTFLAAVAMPMSTAA